MTRFRPHRHRMFPLLVAQVDRIANAAENWLTTVELDQLAHRYRLISDNLAAAAEMRRGYSTATVSP